MIKKGLPRLLILQSLLNKRLVNVLASFNEHFGPKRINAGTSLELAANRRLKKIKQTNKLVVKHNTEKTHIQRTFLYVKL